MMRHLPIAAALFSLAAALIAAPIPKESEKLPPPTEKQLEQSQNNLKEIGIAIHSYHDTIGKMPADVVDKDGKAILSWRVQMLPYLEEEALYKEFKLDEPWDSNANSALIARIPKAFEPIRVKADKGQTFYRGFDGPDTVFEAGTKQTLLSMTDGTSNTIMVVEAGEPCIWSKPDDLPYGGKKPLPKLGGLFDGDFHVLMGDGSTFRGSSKTMHGDEFRKLLTKSDGMVADPEKALGIEKK